jgi:hypothetical protein
MRLWEGHEVRKIEVIMWCGIEGIGGHGREGEMIRTRVWVMGGHGNWQGGAKLDKIEQSKTTHLYIHSCGGFTLSCFSQSIKKC